MSILVTVEIAAAPATVQKIEQDHPEVMDPIVAAASKYMTGHQRIFQEDRVMDLDQFASKEDYDAFIAEAGEHIKRYGELIGTPTTDGLWTVDDTPMPA